MKTPTKKKPRPVTREEIDKIWIGLSENSIDIKRLENVLIAVGDELRPRKRAEN